ncbi:MAG: hypothetical protein WDO68_01745 [Gammaproteobacteria bacterium]
MKTCRIVVPPADASTECDGVTYTDAAFADTHVNPHTAKENNHDSSFMCDALPNPVFLEFGVRRVSIARTSV